MIKSLEGLKLTTGQHRETDGACIMELVSYLANEPWSDTPQCASRALTTFCIWLNDRGDQEHRNKLQELAPRIVNTNDPAKDVKRAKIFAEYAQWCADAAAGYSIQFNQYQVSAPEAAQIAAEYAAGSVSDFIYPNLAALYATISAKVAMSAKSAAYAALSAKYAAKYAAFRSTLYDKAIETVIRCLEVV